jgi:tRNA pseudouridine55 synthase
MKRGSTNLSFVVGIDKPVGLTSHDVVNRCRRIFGEKRIGHTGTLDPMASGAMAVCVGPATKLSNYLTFHDKAYLARIVFGAATDTDDAEGAVVRTAEVPQGLSEYEHAQSVLAGLLGKQNQLPPAYSAIKVGGVKSYEAARKGAVIDLRPREIEVMKADLAFIGRDEAGALFWDVRFEVSAGTYIRSLARDLGIANGTCAHLGALRRVRSGRLSVGECVSLESLEENPTIGRLDPVRLLGARFVAVQEAEPGKLLKRIANGGQVELGEVSLLEYADFADGGRGYDDYSRCTPNVMRSTRPLEDGEIVSILHENKLVALYKHDAGSGILRSCCGFAQGVTRGIV